MRISVSLAITARNTIAGSGINNDNIVYTKIDTGTTSNTAISLDLSAVIDNSVVVSTDVNSPGIFTYNA